jgi:hypothetical protein
MPANVGYSFDPAAGQQGQNGDETGTGGFGTSRLSPQQAVKLLSLRIPERPAPQAIAPQALLQGRGAAGSPGMASVIQGLMRAFLPGLQSGAGGMGQSGGAMGQSGGAMPSPRVIPGLEGPIQAGGFDAAALPAGFDPIAEWRRRMPTGGITGGTQFDPTSPNFVGGGFQPMPSPTPAPQASTPQLPQYLQSKMARQDMLEPLF